MTAFGTRFAVTAVATAMLAVAPVSAQNTKAAAGDHPQTVLFIGNSFTYGAHSPVWKYRWYTVNDLNGGDVGGVPALFKLFTQEAGLNYAVSLETSGGKSLQWHWDHKRQLVDRPWDHVVLQEYSTLDKQKPGDPASLVTYSGKFAQMFKAKNSHVDVSLTATWSRPDQTYLKTGAWYGKPITQMALDLRHGYDMAADASSDIDRVNPVGQVFSCAIAAGVGNPDPYNGIAYGKVDLWAYDHYHASRFGYYLEALTVFIDITGQDPRQFGSQEQAARELGISPDDAVRLQDVAWARTHGQDCATLFKPA
ncbi:hypothetical protein GCM10023219_27660 [Stakelama sediminis]|uniref:PEP-CTERM sorting domain-containing protein n=1 Tax=Stakelama sediminis TaxID=463200 RepID=A0A840YXR9_9SPHN|nr:PEP-CTERM sorting domain-containing protein [Stakelama sediminis]MBB5718551.1 hypothetical protein [Stakelama sediminis]